MIRIPSGQPARSSTPVELGHISTVAGFTVGVIGWLPGTELRELAIQLCSVAWQHPPHRVRQTPPGEELEEVMGATSGVGADEDTLHPDASSCLAAGRG